MSRKLFILAIPVMMILGACQAPPPRAVAPPPRPVNIAQITMVAAYPAKGQSETQVGQDRYECHNWAVKQSHFDPSQPAVPPAYHVHVARPAGSDVAAGGLFGALIGASVTRPRDAGTGALVGAVTGAAIGAASDQSRNEQADRQQARLDAAVVSQNQAIEDQARGYRRAITACLEGRGYTVQ